MLWMEPGDSISSGRQKKAFRFELPTVNLSLDIQILKIQIFRPKTMSSTAYPKVPGFCVSVFGEQRPLDEDKQLV